MSATSRSDRVLRLRDNRLLGYSEMGAESGDVLFFFHGTPGSRLVLSGHEAVSRACGVRIISPERPGYGLSSAMPGRTIGGWAHDVEALADSLGIDRFAVAGASGGGPYALAVARALPRRVTMAGLVSTAGEVVDRSILRRLDAGNRMKFGLPLIAPKVLRFDLALVGVLARIAPALLARGVAQLSASDRDLMQQGARRKALTSLLREAFHGGSLGVYSDMMLGSRPWDFDASEVRVPTYLWHGEHDAMAPFWMAQAVAKRIPSSDLKVLAGRGHLILGEPNVLDSLLGLVCAHA